MMFLTNQKIMATAGAYPPVAPCQQPHLIDNKAIRQVVALANNLAVFQDSSKRWEERRRAQTEFESYFAKRGLCDSVNPQIVNDARVRLSMVDDVRLEAHLAGTDSLVAALHADIACMFSAIITSPPVTNTTLPDRIRNWFPHLKQIGAESVFGYALTGSLTDRSDIAVFKTSRDIKAGDDLIHEAMIGMYALNHLRTIVPNFVYTYGYMECSPVVIEGRQVVTWCTNTETGSKIPYLIIENVRDAQTFVDWIVLPEIDAQEFFRSLLQIFNALQVANRLRGFTHYDLHANNVLVRRFTQPVGIPMYGPTGVVQGYIVTQYIPYIIDYGQSRCQVGGVNLGIYGFETITGNRADSSFPLHDVYRLLLGAHWELDNMAPPHPNTTAKLEICRRFFAYFGVDLRALPDFAPERFRGRSMREFWEWSQRTFTPVWYPTSQAVTTSGAMIAPLQNPVTHCDYYNDIATVPVPQSSLEYCQAYDAINADTQLTPEAKAEAIRYLNTSFVSVTQAKSTWPVIQRLVAEATALARGPTDDGKLIPYLTNISPFTVEIFVREYRQTFIDVLKVKDIYVSIFSTLRSLACALDRQRELTEERRKLLLDMEANNLKPMREYLERNYQIANHNKRVVEAYVNTALRLRQSATAELNFWSLDHPAMVASLQF